MERPSVDGRLVETASPSRCGTGHRILFAWPGPRVLVSALLLVLVIIGRQTIQPGSENADWREIASCRVVPRSPSIASISRPMERCWRCWGSMNRSGSGMLTDAEKLPSYAANISHLRALRSAPMACCASPPEITPARSRSGIRLRGCGVGKCPRTRRALAAWSFLHGTETWRQDSSRERSQFLI